MIKLELFDAPFTGQEDAAMRQEIMRVDLIMNGLGSLDFIETHYYSSDEDAAVFAANAVVQQLLAERGAEALPILLVDGAALTVGRYPTNEEFSAYTGVRFTIEKEPVSECGCGHHHHHGAHEACGCGHHHHHDAHEACGCDHHHHMKRSGRMKKMVGYVVVGTRIKKEVVNG